MHLEVTDVRTLGTDEPHIRTYEYHGTPVSLGAHTGNTLQLPHTEIQDYHGILLPAGDGHEQWTYQPVSPDAEAEINGATVTVPVQLEDGDVIKILHWEIKFQMDQAPELELPEPTNLDELAKIKQYPLPSRADVRRGDENVSLSPTMQKEIASFGLLLRECGDLPSLLDVTLGALIRALGARTAWMGVRRSVIGPLELVEGRSDRGEYAGEPWNLEAFTYRCMTRQQFIRLPKTGQPDTQSVIAVPILGERAAMGLLIVDTRRRTHVYDEGDLHLLTMISRLVASQLDAILGDMVTQRNRLASDERSLVREVQARLDPTSVPDWPGLHMSAFVKPGTESAGDIHDVTRLPNGLASFMIATVKAPPIRTAIALAEVRSGFRVAAMHADPPHVLLQELNYLLCGTSNPCALSIANFVMNPKTGATEFATAGEMGALIVDARGNARELGDAGQPAVGVDRGFKGIARKERLRDGETLVLFTGGCATVCDESGAALGRERFVDTLCEGFDQPVGALMSELLTDLGGFLKTGRPIDDITVLLVRREKPAS